MPTLFKSIPKIIRTCQWKGDREQGPEEMNGSSFFLLSWLIKSMNGSSFFPLSWLIKSISQDIWS